ncbi:hypothetical protein FEM48_Zijuj03G0032200 [Ziziphus jujuba var. spinosa]|uniref:Uncharacterized protein n=1 Tax=Ziziphus jujuba var. spinosa TaxID=714518 RepID=A0A978VMU7_ZIZJJ|nr:hypothetical protein FEM48_Zijuj03G0032200 [Ziziphus jujuba var. spinosa]
MTQPKGMDIRECKRMKKTIANDGSEIGVKIIFRQLVALHVQCLSSLTSFCSGNFMMRFPKLKYVGISYCPEMRSFSHGVISSPQLDKLTLLDEKWEDGEFYTNNNEIKLPEEDHIIIDDKADSHKRIKELVEGDVNTTIRQLWEDQVGLINRFSLFIPVLNF